jgi:hypothetical protein
MIIISILAIYALSFVLRNLDGPFDLFSKARRWLFNNRIVGVFAFKLTQCPWCFGFHCGWLIGLLLQLAIFEFSFPLLILWGLAGSSIAVFGDIIYERLNSNDDK